MTRTPLVALALAIALAGPLPASAYKDDDAPKPQALLDAEKAMKGHDYGLAIAKLQPFVAANPKNVDALADLGKSYLETKDADAAIRYLAQALELESSKLDTNLWLGEAYLAKGMLPQAEERLKRISRLCFFGCSEEHQLKAEIATYKAAH
ncbi:MAG: tetratricopeptide repeat protein [Alphaproteobacteria bacterium]|nr:tetratricopeptide repeat protein [Alphaproteobacteria bacterium]